MTLGLQSLMQTSQHQLAPDGGQSMGNAACGIMQHLVAQAATACCRTRLECQSLSKFETRDRRSLQLALRLQHAYRRRVSCPSRLGGRK